RCRATYSEASPWLVRGGWYAREVRRCAPDRWQRGRGSRRRTAGAPRSRPGGRGGRGPWGAPPPPPPPAAPRPRGAGAGGGPGGAALRGRWAGVAASGQVGVDGLWARLRGRAKRVAPLPVETATGVRRPGAVAREEGEAGWLAPLARAERAGLELDALRGVV